MKQIFTLAFLCLSSLGAMAQKDCQHAVAVGPGTTAVSFLPASQVPSPICTAGQNNNPSLGAWYSYTPTELHTTTISTVASGQDTRVHIYNGACGALVCVGGDDDSGGNNYTSLASFTAQPNVTYYIAFDNNWSSSDFNFTLSEAQFVAPLFESHQVNIQGYHSCIVDLNGDYLDDIVSPSEGVVNVLYQADNDSGFTAGTLTAPTTEYMPSWSMAAGDYNKDGFNDLLYGDSNGATLMLTNSAGTAFTTKLETPIDVFSQRTNFVDINNDGNLDAFICHDVAPTVFFINNGSGGGNFHQSGVNGAADLGIYPSGGNYASLWTDYDNDGDIDMYLAKCRGANNDAAKDELHRNNGDGTFTNVAAELGFADYHQSWSSAWADFDNDGFMDVLVGSNAGLDGSLFPHKLMKNNGDGTFTNVTAGSGYDTFDTQNRDYIAYDFDNDGFVDIFGGGNAIMYNNGDFTFTPVSVGFGPGPVGDLNNDGFLDIQNDGTIHFNYGNDNNWLKVNLKGVQSNRNGIGARIEVYTSDTSKQIREIRSGEGFEYMSSLNAHFGLGQTETIEQVVVRWPSGTIDIVENPTINQSLLITEGQTLGRNDATASMFTMYPNPAKDVLNINSNDLSIVKAHIYDLGGRLVKTADVANGTVPVQQLTKGTYIIIMQDTTGRQHTSKFIKG